MDFPRSFRLVFKAIIIYTRLSSKHTFTSYCNIFLEDTPLITRRAFWLAYKFSCFVLGDTIHDVSAALLHHVVRAAPYTMFYSYFIWLKVVLLLIQIFICFPFFYFYGTRIVVPAADWNCTPYSGDSWLTVEKKKKFEYQIIGLKKWLKERNRFWKQSAMGSSFATSNTI